MIIWLILEIVLYDIKNLCKEFNTMFKSGCMERYVLVQSIV